MKNARQLAADTIEDVRRSVKLIREGGTPFDLNEALQTMVTRAERNRGLVVDLQVDIAPLPGMQAYQLFCIVQEALNNAQRHGRATAIQIKLTQKDGAINLEIKDDGKGFDPTLEKSGIGLKSMTERADVLGGKLHVESAEGAGTRIELAIPTA